MAPPGSSAGQLRLADGSMFRVMFMATAATPALPPVADAAAPAMARAQNPSAPAGAQQDNGQSKPKKKSDD